MDFLFASLPDTNFQMTDEQLVLWQRNAIFECDCDNFINRRVEAVHDICNQSAAHSAAISAAISSHGLRPPRSSSESDSDSSGQEEEDAAPPPAQRPRVSPDVVEVVRPSPPEAGNFLGSFYQEAITLAIRARGLGLQRNP